MRSVIRDFMMRNLKQTRKVLSGENSYYSIEGREFLAKLRTELSTTRRLSDYLLWKLCEKVYQEIFGPQKPKY